MIDGRRPAIALVFGVIAVSAALAAPPVARAAPQVSLDIGLENGAPPTAMHQWQRLLTSVGVDSVRIRSRQPSDKLSIENRGTPAAPAYRVVGLLSRDSELSLPGGKFKTSDGPALGEWLKRLRDEGPVRAQGAPPPPFGMPADQLAKLRKELARPLGSSTLAKLPSEVLKLAGKNLTVPPAIDSTDSAKLRTAAPVADEMSTVATGTALAYVLDQAGLALVPRLDAERRPACAVVPERAASERWPVGWPPGVPKRDLLPALFEQVEVELDDVELSRAVAAIGERLAVPVLCDYRALARAQVDLAAIRASLPAKRSTYEIVLNKLLVPKLLRHELRIDDAGRPFLWITTAQRGS